MDDNLRNSLEGGESQEEGIRPDFLKKDKAKNVLGAAEQAAGAVLAAKTGNAGAAAKTGGKASGKASSKSGTGGATKNDGAGDTTKTGGGLYNNGKSGVKESVEKGFNEGRTSQKEKGEASLSLPKGLKAAAPFAILLIAVVGIIFLIVGLPVIMIGAIDYNLQKVLGFTETVGILEKQGEYVTAEMLGNGKVPSGYASDLAANGVVVGQVAEDGKFYQTDVYIADIDKKEGLIAANGSFNYISDDEGELAILYDGEVVSADNFVARVESDPTLYAAYSSAADISTKYYYGDDVEKVYQDMGVSRGNFNDWETTGDYAADEAAYKEILVKVLDSKADLTLGGKSHDIEAPQATTDVEAASVTPDSSGNWQESVTEGKASEKDAYAAEQTKEYITGWKVCEEPRKDSQGNIETDANGNAKMRKFWCPTYSSNATARAAELLNTAVSSGEPYLASNAFIAVEESIQRARVNGDGPVNHVMNTLTEGTEVTYQNVQTGANETKKLAILETENFRAVVSDAPYSLNEAENFGRDRVLKTTGQASDEVIKMTTVGVSDSKAASSVSRNGKWGDSADKDIIAKADENVSLAISKSNSEMFQSVVGGNRIVEGGSFLSNTINSKVIGAMPSNEAAIAKYHKEVEETLARKAEAERASLSPFDISSPNTFMGNIVHNVAAAALKNYSGGISAMSAVTLAGDAAGTAVANLTDSASAEGKEQTFTTLSGSGCATVGAVKVSGDLYCTSHNTVETDYYNYTRDQWKEVVLYENEDGTVVTLGDSLDDEDKIKEKSELGDFVTLGMDRYATVGVKSAEACEAYHNMYDNFLKKITAKLKDMVGLYASCSGVDDNLATGAAYTFGDEGKAYAKYLSGYMLYDEVYSLLSDEESSVAEYRERYYAKYPRDHSEAGIIAMRSGLSVEEAEVALKYSDFLNEIASHDAYYTFGALVVAVSRPLLRIHSDEMAGQLYAWYQKESEQDSKRHEQEVSV